MDKQDYKKIEFIAKDSFKFKKNGIVAYKLNGYINVYVSNNCHIKPKGLHIILKNINEAIKEFDAADEEIKIIIVSYKDRFGGFGMSDAKNNEIYLNEVVWDKNKIKHEGANLGDIEKHEVWHLKQAVIYRNKQRKITKDNYNNYIYYTRMKAKMHLDSLGVNDDGVGVISKYAFSMYFYEKYDEVEAEIKAVKGVLFILQNSQMKFKK